MPLEPLGYPENNRQWYYLGNTNSKVSHVPKRGKAIREGGPLCEVLNKKRKEHIMIWQPTAIEIVFRIIALVLIFALMAAVRRHSSKGEDR